MIIRIFYLGCKTCGTPGRATKAGVKTALSVSVTNFAGILTYGLPAIQRLVADEKMLIAGKVQTVAKIGRLR